MAMEASKTSVTSTWLQRNSELYHSAIRAPFILSIREGKLDHRFYTRWLGQDYLFVKEFCRFAANVVVKAPESIGDEDLDILMGGLSALQAELLWFRSQSVQWNTKFEGLSKHSVTEGYCRLLRSLAAPDIGYPVIISVLWATEMVYNESFATCLETDANTPPELLEACQRWGNKDFKTYCISLRRMADRALENAAPYMLQRAEELFQEILMQEVLFLEHEL